MPPDDEDICLRIFSIMLCSVSDGVGLKLEHSAGLFLKKGFQRPCSPQSSFSQRSQIICFLCIGLADIQGVIQ